MATPPKSMRVAQNKAWSFDLSSVITICVGPVADCTTFLVHNPFLTARSEFFRRALNGSWTEARTRTINLTDDDADVFALYLNLVYKNQLPTTFSSDEELRALERNEFSREVYKEYSLLFKLYILAEKLQDSMTKDEALTGVLGLAFILGPGAEWIMPPLSMVQLVYGRTPKCSPARRLLVDLWSNIHPDDLEEVGDELPKDFLLETVLSLRAGPLTRVGNTAKTKGITPYLEGTGSSKDMTTS